MPPKKQKSTLFRDEIDLTQYTRRSMEVTSGAVSEPPPSGIVRNTETLFPEWKDAGISEELWDAGEMPVEGSLYPPTWMVARLVPIRSLLGLEEPESKSKDKKKEPKKKDAHVEVTELALDAYGRPLPRVVLESGSCEWTGWRIPRGFEDTVVVPEEPSEPRHRLMCYAFKAVERFASLCGADPDAFLWRSIYPQSSEGRPCYNPNGKYCVKLYLAGRWRRVAVSDAVPVSESGRCLLPRSSEALELWPTLLAKALYAAVAGCGYLSVLFNDQMESQLVSFLVHMLTGWSPRNGLHEPLDTDALARSGVPLVEEDLIPLDAAVDVAEPDRDRDMAELKTKAALQRELAERVERRRCMCEAIARREALIAGLSQKLLLPLPQCTLLLFRGEVMQVMAVTTGPAAKLLVAFETTQPTVKDTAEELSDFRAPPQTMLRSRWITVDDAVVDGRLVVLETLRHCVGDAALSLHWAPAAAELLVSPKGQKSTGKDKVPEPLGSPKGQKPVFKEKSVTPVVCEYSPANPSLVVLDLSERDLLYGEGYVDLSVVVMADVIEGGASGAGDRVVLVLQELPGADPHKDCFGARLELNSSETPLRLSLHTVRVPTRIASRGKVVLWVRLLTSASVFVGFRSRVPVVAGDAESLWSRHLGGHCVSKEGDSPATAKGTEQLAFRMRLSSESAEGSDTVLAFMHIASPAASLRVGLLLTDSSGRGGEPLARLSGGCFTLSSADTVLLIARCLESVDDIPAFKWSVLLLSRHELRCEMLPLDRGVVRYSGSYVPNNRLRIFRDVLSLEKGSNPLAIRVTLGQAGGGDDVDKWLVLRIFRKADKCLVLEATARSSVSLYCLPEELFAKDEPAVEKDKPKDRKDKQPKKGPAAETVDLVVECTVDERAMAVPGTWRAPTPAVYDADAPADAPRVFPWSLDILCGTVARMAHDISDLERFHAMKAEWEDRSVGRGDRAAAARAYLSTRQQLGGDPSLTTAAETVALLGIALEKDLVELRAAEDVLQASPQSRPQVVDGQRRVLSSEDRAAGFAMDEQRRSEGEAVSLAALANVAAFNSEVKGLTAARMHALMETVVDNVRSNDQLWSLRTKYKADVDQKNASLQYLLQRAATAAETVFASETGTDPKKGKGKDAKSVGSAKSAASKTGAAARKK